MKIENAEVIEAYKLKHAQTKIPLDLWLSICRGRHFKSFNDLRLFFPRADNLGKSRSGKGFNVLFNIKGNKHRMLVLVEFADEKMVIKWVGTHAEYSKGDYTKYL